ncbi:MAG: hypothetical protein Alpg2KO_19200 [Alphaproteobacteria bacterium]
MSKPSPIAALMRPLALALAVSVGLTACGKSDYATEVQDREPVASSEAQQWYPMDPYDRVVTFIDYKEPAFLDVTQRRYENVVVERTVYENNTVIVGENFLQTHVLFNPKFSLFEDDTSIKKLRFERDDIQATLAREFPGLYPEISANQPRNVYGWYNFATAYAGADVVCIYAWQVLAGKGRVLPDRYRDLVVEYRECEQGATVRQLLNRFEKLRFKESTGVLPRERIYHPDDITSTLGDPNGRERFSHQADFVTPGGG